MFTLKEIRLLLEAVETLVMEYGETPERRDMVERLRAERDRRVAEIDAGRY